MKIVYLTVCLILIAAAQAPDSLASEMKTQGTKADQYYRQGKFKNAYKAYFKLAKTGDHHSQHQVAKMYTNGEGRTIDLKKAYAWSVLAAESGEDEIVASSDALLQRISDKDKALSSATKLKSKYGKEALKIKADKIAKRAEGGRPGRCITGSRMGCRDD